MDGVNRAVMKQLLKLYRESHLAKRLPAYDGRKSLYTAGPLPFVSKEFKVTRKMVQAVPGERGSSGLLSSLLHVLTCIIYVYFYKEGRLMHLKKLFRPVGRSFYSNQLGIQPLGEGLDSWRSFSQNMSSTSFIGPVPVIEFVTKLINKDISRPLSDSDRVKEVARLAAALYGLPAIVYDQLLLVSTNYDPYKRVKVCTDCISLSLVEN